MTITTSSAPRKRVIPVRLVAIALAGAIAATACGSDVSATDASDQVEPPQATPTSTSATPTTIDDVSTTAATESEAAPSAPPASDLVEVTFDSIGVTTVIPGDWVQAPDGSFSDGVSKLAVIAMPTSDVATSGVLDDYEPIDQLVAGFTTWHLLTREVGDVVEGVAAAEIADMTYGFVLTAPAELAEQYLEAVIAPALEAFEIGDAPDSVLSTGSIEIDGRKMAYATGGIGEVTVVFEAGLGNGMQSWALVAPEVAELSQVFVSDRPGYGASSLTDSPRDGATMVAELREALQATGHEPPYVLVGHSLGGTLMDLFTRTHPDEVAGLVLVDSRHHEFTARCLAQLNRQDCLIPTDEELDQVEQPIRGEYRGSETTAEQLTQAPSFPQLPLAVIVAGTSEFAPAFVELWNQTQQDYADMVRAARYSWPTTATTISPSYSPNSSSRPSPNSCRRSHDRRRTHGRSAGARIAAPTLRSVPACTAASASEQTA